MTNTTTVHFFDQGFLYCTGRNSMFTKLTGRADEVTCKSCKKRLVKAAKAA